MFFFAIIYSVVISYTFTKILPEDRNKDQVKELRKKFFNAADSIKTLGDNNEKEVIKMLFNSLNRETNGALAMYGFANILEDYAIHIKSNDKTDNGKTYKVLTDIIDDEKKQEPYSQLPSVQRRTLRNLEDAVKSNNAELASYNLNELNSILTLTNNENQELKRQNSWSIPLAIIGLIITLVFGLISILRPISYQKIREVIKESLKQ